MNPPFKLSFLTKNQNYVAACKWKRERIAKEQQYARTKLLRASGVKFIRQCFNGFAFYLEQTSYYFKRSLMLKVSVEKPSLIFIYIMAGDLHAAIPGRAAIAQRQFFAHLVPAGEYSWLVNRGNKKIIYFTLSAEWLLRMKSEYPELVKIIRKIMDGGVPNQIFPHYNMTLKTLAQLDKLMSCSIKSPVLLEEKLLNTINGLLKEYQAHLTAPYKFSVVSNGQLANVARDHIIDLVSKGIIPYVWNVSIFFNVESRKLRRMCVKAFSMNVQDLITDAQMKRAKEMLNKGMLVKDVSVGLGFSEISVFSNKYKRYFGYSPSNGNVGKTN